MGWLIALGIVTALAVLPLGMDVNYDEDGIRVSVDVWKISVLVFPRPKKVKRGKHGKEAEKKTAPSPVEEPLPQPPQPPKQPVKKEKKGGGLSDFLPFVKLALNFLGDFRGRLRMDILDVKLTMAGGDPCDLAVNFGRTWAGIGGLLPQLERFFVIKKRDIDVQCDFMATQTLIKAHLRLTISLWQMTYMLAVYAIRVLKEYVTFKNKRKGGKENEQEVT